MVTHIEIRPELLRFATHCELILRENDHKNSMDNNWSHMSVEQLRFAIAHTTEKMVVSLQKENPFTKMGKISDVANYLMFLFDHFGRDIAVDCDCGCFSTSAYPEFDGS